MLARLLQEGSVVEIVATFTALAIIAAFILSLIFIIVGGISFILSAGNEEKIKRAIHTIRFAIIGFVITFLATFIVSFIANLLEIPFNISFSMIVGIMKEIGAALGT